MKNEKIKATVRWSGLSASGCLLMMSMLGCGSSGTTQSGANAQANQKAAAPPVTAGAAPVRERPKGVPADRPKFPGER